MSKKCAICGKKPVMGNSISHAHNINKRRFMPNLQKIKIEAGGKAKKVYVCTKCIKSGRAKKVF